MNNQTRQRLFEAKQACLSIEEFTAGTDFAGYMGNAMMRAAVERQLRIVGEALKRATEADVSLPELLPPIRQMISMCTALIHRYDAVDHMLVWDVVQAKLVPLRQKLEQLL
jgi:uncharacterized protein with HEPN domain